VRQRFAPGSAFWRQLAYAGARFGPEQWLRLSPPLFGVAFALALGPERRAVRENLRTVFGKRSPVEEGLDVARTFASYASCLAEALAGERPAVQHATKHFRDEAAIRALLESGRGLVIATAHVGAWDVAAPLLARDLELPVIVTMSAEADLGARALHDGVRTKNGVRVVHVGGHPLDALPLLHHLRAGGIVAVQMDRVPPGSRSLELRLFERAFRVPAGPFVLAALAEVPLLPLFVRRRGFLDYEVVAHGPIHLPARPSAGELRAAAERALGELERFIRANPTQWFRFA
jgi:lauroyl/myristoyl acyltransferase